MNLLKKLKKLAEPLPDKVIAIYNKKRTVSAHGTAKQLFDAVKKTADLEVKEKDKNLFNGSESILEENQSYHSLELVVD